MAKRKGLSPKRRFEILKRDGFTCQYCGQKPPNAILRVDHIEPVARGGNNDEGNLITSCFDCNSGKSDNEILSDNSDYISLKKPIDLFAAIEHISKAIVPILIGTVSDSATSLTDTQLFDIAREASYAIQRRGYNTLGVEFKTESQKWTSFYGGYAELMANYCQVELDRMCQLVRMSEKFGSEPHQKDEVFRTIKDLVDMGCSFDDIENSLEEASSIREWNDILVFGSTEEAERLFHGA